MSDRINLSVVRAEFDTASRKPHLMEAWGYEWGHRLLAELERLQAMELKYNRTLGPPNPPKGSKPTEFA